jgi:hypothetical protein
MTRLLLAYLAATALLSGCAGFGRTEALGLTQALLAATPQDAITQGTFLTGTLADSGSFETAVAPVKTRLAVVRRSAAKAVREKRINMATAKEILRLSDKADAKINLAWSDKQGTLAAKLALADAEALLDQADTLLEGTRK